MMRSKRGTPCPVCKTPLVFHWVEGAPCAQIDCGLLSCKECFMVLDRASGKAHLSRSFARITSG